MAKFVDPGAGLKFGSATLMFQSLEDQMNDCICSTCWGVLVDIILVCLNVPEYIGMGMSCGLLQLMQTLAAFTPDPGV